MSKKPKPTEISLEEFLAERIDNLRHELAHANNAVTNHTRGLNQARELQMACTYRIDELEHLRTSLTPTGAIHDQEGEETQTPGSPENPEAITET